MSAFDDYFERNRSKSYVTKFSSRLPLELYRHPLYLYFIRKFGNPKNFISKLVYLFLTNKYFIFLENVFRPAVIKAKQNTQLKFSPAMANECLKVLDRTIINYRNGNEPELAHLIDLLVPDDGIFIDVGANWGYFSFFLALRHGFEGAIHSFEPILSNHSLLMGLKNNFNLKSIKLHKIALANSNSSQLIYYYDLLKEGATLLLPSDEKGYDIDLSWGKCKSLAIEISTLDSFTFGRMDFLKIDVEGSEYECLQGSLKQIELHRPYIFLESHFIESNQESISKSLLPFVILEKLGYKFYLPSWVQKKSTFFVGIGWEFEMEHFALTPFEIHERKDFGITILNIFACHNSKIKYLGTPFELYFSEINATN